MAGLEARLKALDAASKRSDPLAPIGAGARKATPNVLALAQAEARLLVAQGDLAGASNRLETALAGISTKSVQTVNAQRQLLAVQTQLATGTTTLGGHFKALEATVAASGSGFAGLQGNLGAIGGAIGGLPGQLLSVGAGIGAVTTAISIGVGVVSSFGEAFKFKAELDATTASINAQLKGVRDTGEVYASAARFAGQYKLTQQETTDAISASIGVMRASKAPIEDILSVLARMQVLSPEQSLQEAAIALKALASGDTTSLVTRFEVGRDVANQMKAEIQGGADAVSVMSKFLGDTGIGMDALAARTTGAMGAMKELAQAQEQLKLAQASFAQGPGMAILGVQIAVTRDVTKGLGGDFQALNAIINDSGVGALNPFLGILGQYNDAVLGAGQATLQWMGVLAPQQAATAAAAQTTQVLTQAQTELVGAMSAESAAADAASASTAAATAATQASAEASLLASAQQDMQSVATANLKIQTDAAVASFLSLNPSIDGAGIAAAVAAGKIPALVGQLASLRVAAYSARDAVAALAAQQAVNVKVLAAGGGGIAAPGRTSGRNNDINAVFELQKANTAATKARSDQIIAIGNDQQKVNELEKQYGAAVKASGATSAAAISAETNLLQQRQSSAKSAAKAVKGGGGGGGAKSPKLSDQQRLNNQLLASQDQYEQKAEDAEQTHLDKIVSINKDFQSKMKDAQDNFQQSQADGRAGFYDSLGSIEDAGLRNTFAAQYEAAFQEADKIAAEKGADIGQKFLEAKQAALEAQAGRASKIDDAQKAGDTGKAEYLAGVDRLYREAEDRKVAAAAAGQDSIAATRDAQLAAEGSAYTTAQDKLGAAADTAAQRRIDAALRSGQAVDAEGLKVDGLTARYDALATAGARTGVAPTAGAASAPAGAASAPAAATDGNPLLTSMDAIVAAVNAAKEAIVGAARDTTGAVRSLKSSGGIAG